MAEPLRLLVEVAVAPQRGPPQPYDTGRRAAYGVPHLGREHVDRRDIGEVGHHEVGQLPAGGVHVERGADPDGGGGEQGDMAAGLLQFLALPGDVGDL